MGCYTHLQELIPFDPTLKEKCFRVAKEKDIKIYKEEYWEEYYCEEIPPGGFFDTYHSWLTCEQLLTEEDINFFHFPEDLDLDKEFIWEFPTGKVIAAKDISSFPWVSLHPYDILFFKKEDFLSHVDHCEKWETENPDKKRYTTEDFNDLRKAMENFIEGRMFVYLG